MVHFSLSISRGGFPSTLLERRAGCSIDVVLVGVHQCMQNFVPQDHKRSRAGFFEGGVMAASVLVAALGDSSLRIMFLGRCNHHGFSDFSM